jgi:glycerol uptake facilitator-like aquaporin
LPWSEAGIYIVAQFLGASSACDAVGLYITAAIRFILQGRPQRPVRNSFANAAVTIARSLSDTFARIVPAGMPAFIVSQLAGMLAAVVLSRWLWSDRLTA